MAKNREYSILRINARLLAGQMIASLVDYEEGEFKEIGLTLPQFFIISAIKFLQPPVTPSDISKFTGRNLNTVTLTLDRMEKVGLVKKKRDLPDRRKLRLSLTPKSKKLFSKATIPFRAIPHEIMSCLSDDELQTYIDLTQKVKEKIFEKLGLQEGTYEPYSHRIEILANIIKEESNSKETD